MARKTKKSAPRSLAGSKQAGLEPKVFQDAINKVFAEVPERIERLNRAVDVVKKRVEASQSSELKTATAVSKEGVPAWANTVILKRLREEVGVSQQTLSKITGITRSVLANYETFVTSPTLENARTIYMALAALGSKEANDMLIGIAMYDKLNCLVAIEMLKGEAEELAKRCENLEKRAASLDSFIQKHQKREASNG